MLFYSLGLEKEDNPLIVWNSANVDSPVSFTSESCLMSCSRFLCLFTFIFLPFSNYFCFNIVIVKTVLDGQRHDLTRAFFCWCTWNETPMIKLHSQIKQGSAHFKRVWNLFSCESVYTWGKQNDFSRIKSVSITFADQKIPESSTDNILIISVFLKGRHIYLKNSTGLFRPNVLLFAVFWVSNAVIWSIFVQFGSDCTKESLLIWENAMLAVLFLFFYWLALDGILPPNET